PASQPAHTIPPALAEKAPRCSRSPHDAQAASSGMKPAASSSLSLNESACARLAVSGCWSSSWSSLESKLYAGWLGSWESNSLSTASHAWVARWSDSRLSRRFGCALTVEAEVTVHSSPLP